MKDMFEGMLAGVSVLVIMSVLTCESAAQPMLNIEGIQRAAGVVAEGTETQGTEDAEPVDAFFGGTISVTGNYNVATTDAQLPGSDTEQDAAATGTMTLGNNPDWIGWTTTARLILGGRAHIPEGERENQHNEWIEALGGIYNKGTINQIGEETYLYRHQYKMTVEYTFVDDATPPQGQHDPETVKIHSYCKIDDSWLKAEWIPWAQIWEVTGEYRAADNAKVTIQFNAIGNTGETKKKSYDTHVFAGHLDTWDFETKAAGMDPQGDGGLNLHVKSPNVLPWTIEHRGIRFSAKLEYLGHVVVDTEYEEEEFEP